MLRICFGALLAIFISPGAEAQTLRNLEVPSKSAWQHAETSLILPPQIAGLVRSKIQDTGTEELDVIATYEGGPGDLVATVYLFRSQIPSVPVWFDRARSVLANLPQYGLNGGDGRQPSSFALPGRSVATGLRVTYPLAAAGLTSTGLAVAPVNGWMAKVRLSSGSLAPAELDQRLADFLAGIRWPKESGSASAVAPIEACPAPLSYKRAKMIKPDMAQALLSSIFAVAAASKTAGPPTSYCRESDAGVPYGVYRADASPSGYVIALADAGRAIGVHQSLSLDEKQEAPFAVTLMDLGQSSVFPSFNRLPSPKQVMDVLPKTRPISSARPGTTATITIDPGAAR